LEEKKTANSRDREFKVLAPQNLKIHPIITIRKYTGQLRRSQIMKYS
jgi:hypothetical protein